MGGEGLVKGGNGDVISGTERGRSGKEGRGRCVTIAIVHPDICSTNLWCHFIVQWSISSNNSFSLYLHNYLLD